MPPRIIRARRRSARLRGANAPEDAEMGASAAAGEETVTSSVAVPALTRQQALGPLFSRVVNDEDLAVLSVVLEQMDDLDDVARLRQTCRVLRDGVDACMKMNHMRVVTSQDENFAPSTLRQGKASSWRDQMRLQAGGWLIKDPDVLGKACGLGRVEIVRLLLEVGGDKDKATKAGSTPLHVASRKGHLEVVRLLVDAGADMKKAPFYDYYTGKTPLHVACEKGHLEIVRLLIEAGADLIFLSFFCRRDNSEACSIQICFIKDKARDTDCETPLWIASQNGHLEVVRLLLEKGADKDKARNIDGATPMFIASQNGHLEIVRVLVNADADKDKADKHGQTPLLVACGKGHLEVVRLLVVAGADKNKASRMGSTPLQIARVLRHDGIVEMLQRAGATG